MSRGPVTTLWCGPSTVGLTDDSGLDSPSVASTPVFPSLGQ